MWFIYIWMIFFLGSGSINVYDKDFKELEDKLERVEMIFKN